MSQGRHRRASRGWRRALRAVEQLHVPDRRIAPAPAHWRCGSTSTLRQRSPPTRPVPAVSGLESGEPIRDLEDAIDLHERSEAHRLVPGLRRLEGNDDGPRSGETTNESCLPPRPGRRRAPGSLHAGPRAHSAARSIGRSRTCRGSADAPYSRSSSRMTATRIAPCTPSGSRSRLTCCTRSRRSPREASQRPSARSTWCVGGLRTRSGTTRLPPPMSGRDFVNALQRTT